ncbi:MAG TPA: DMT family transporter [Candidatus Binatia bacterium]|nr:DMT family transporter [Candidatus Binatia bacterium]
MDPSRARTLAYAGLGLSTVGWASGFVAGKLALGEMSPLPVAAWRYAVAATILLPFAVRQWPAGGLGPAARPLAWMVLCGGVLYPWLFLLALSRTSATNTALLIALNPVLTVLFAPLVGEPLDRRRAAGIALALLGATFVITRGDLAHLRALSLQGGDLIALAAAGAWATFNLTSRSVVGRLTPAVTNCVIYSIGGGALYLLGRSQEPWAQLAAATPTALTGIVLMAVLSSVVAGQFFLVGVRTVGISRTVVFVYLVPVLTALMSTTLLGERFELSQGVGGAAVLAGVYWSSRGAA